jgi:hypothetical protein
LPFKSLDFAVKKLLLIYQKFDFSVPSLHYEKSVSGKTMMKPPTRTAMFEYLVLASAIKGAVCAPDGGKLSAADSFADAAAPAPIVLLSATFRHLAASLRNHRLQLLVPSQFSSDFFCPETSFACCPTDLPISAIAFSFSTFPLQSDKCLGYEPTAALPPEPSPSRDPAQPSARTPPPLRLTIAAWTRL